ncbi:Trafficking protein particle complex subunit 3 [Camellia lanceoleosa]|uniref:Trafficking protein particle complex subunit 3 n=1 Tax=Camellia lanceoleosa TaxID=1840588 RepID=A0ACC0FYV2_9ERIC|nr:Trafficking protein particle complex subunit 3 [Camellia lanceoleosa]
MEEWIRVARVGDKRRKTVGADGNEGGVRDLKMLLKMLNGLMVEDVVVVVDENECDPYDISLILGDSGSHSHCFIAESKNLQEDNSKNLLCDHKLPPSMAPVAPRSGDTIFANVERVNAELFTLTYGAIVRQLLTDLEEVEEVNKQLDQMGYNIGIRLIDEFLAKSNVSRCVDFKETAEVIAKVGFKMFLGVTASVTNLDADGTCCSLILEDNPLVDFVELPDTCQGLYYCNILSGIIRGALEMVSMKTEVTWLRDMLRGDDAFELQVKLLKQIPEEYPYKDDE